MARGRQGRLWLVLLALCLLGTPAAGATGITNSGSDLRDGWYSNQPRLTPDKVAATDFGTLFKHPVDGSVYAQPLVTGSTVIVATERNKVYALDSETGDEKWTADLGAPFPYTLIGWGCSDLTPDLGITSTPVIDTATNTIYLTHKTYAPGSTTSAAYYMDALDASTGHQRIGFPQMLDGVAQNAAPGASPQTFSATTELQRPGLLLLDGVVYAGFGSHCDISPFQGWIMGVSAATGAVKARWVALTGGDGAGIWQSGAGLMSDGSGRVFVSTGNGGAPTQPSDTPNPARLGESVIRLGVQPDGTLKPQDFFAPSDGAHLDDYDADFASGGVTGLRDDVFGTTKYPHMAVAVGKAGYVYLLNRDDLGGVKMGTGQGDDVVARVGPYGGVWSRPGVWPGDGGWIAIPTASPAASDAGTGTSGYLKLYRYRKAADGTPSLDAPVSSTDAFGFSSGAPVITSDGVTSGTATMWIEWAPDGSGAGAQLRAYDAVPQSNKLKLRRSFPLGKSSKFAMPGVGNGRVYVGTRDGYVLGYGAPVDAQVSAPSTTFPTTTVGQTGTASATLKASGTVTITGVGASPSGVFALGAGAPTFPKTLTDGQTLSVPLTFKPTAAGTIGGTLNVTVAGRPDPFAFTLTGTGQAAAALLTATPPVVSFGGTIIGQDLAGTITLGNAGDQPLQVTAVSLPGAPFTIDAPPAVGETIAPDDAHNYTVHYRPTAVGDFVDELTVTTTGGTKTVGLSGSAGIGPRLELSGGGWDFGDVPVGSSATRLLTLTNTGDSPMTITRSKPPTGGPFTVLDALDEGTTIPVGESRSIRVKFTPTTSGPASASWSLNVGDGAGARSIPMTGVGRRPGHLTVGAGGASVGDVVLGARGEATATLGNDGELPLTISGVDLPAAPFALVDAPVVGTVVAPGASLPVRVAFDAGAPGSASGSLVVRSTGGDVTVPLSARAVTAAPIVVVPNAQPVLPPVLGPVMPASVQTKTQAGLAVSRVRVSGDGREVTVSGRVSRRAAGTLKLRLATRVKGRSKAIISTTTVPLAGRGTYAFTFRLPAVARRTGWTRLVADVTYRGSATVMAGTARRTLVRAAGR
jgi:Abnormal spindle-like microcephaly-assoc'd, ASPM-SPD-2-Hydin/PQQ enzyme repeat